jgi:pimeloyl-ACP methyl ester carboxylesterase
MRTTRRRFQFRRAALFSLLLVALFFVVRRALLVSLLALKLVGDPAPLDAWKGAVSHRTVEHAGIPIDIYGAGSGPAILVVHGVNPTGKNSLDLVRLSEGFAQAGFEVFVPDLADMRKLRLRPEEAVNIESVFHFIGRDAGIACFSYGCGPALVAAADPGIRDHVRFTLAFGGYFDVREALEFVVTGPETPGAYGKWAYLNANPDLIDGESGRQRIEKVFAASTPEEFRARLLDVSPAVQSRLDGLSPSRYLREIKAPLILVHGIGDPVIPAQQSIEFAEAARRAGLNCSLTLLRMFGHVNPIRPAVGVRSLAWFYVPEAYRVLQVVNRIAGM